MNCYSRALILIILLLSISACANKQSWGDCPKEDRAKVVRLSTGSKPNKEVLTIKMLSNDKEFTYPEHTKQKDELSLRIGDYFCTAEDYD